MLSKSGRSIHSYIFSSLGETVHSETLKRDSKASFMYQIQGLFYENFYVIWY